ncbi:MAG: hypothetical protein JWM54_1712 [Acidobacteriaceae bacterium]|nr:hypothetical protein [Acidobacteriaceae bacterium]
MGLTEAKLKDLTDKEFDKLYEKHKKVWQDAAKVAKEFVRAAITDGSTPRPDDLLDPLIPVVRANQLFRDHQADNRARGKRFVIAFAEYIIDKNP